MSNFHFIENSLSNSASLPAKDLLLAGGLLGSFVYLSLSTPDKVLMMKPKDNQMMNKTKRRQSKKKNLTSKIPSSCKSNSQLPQPSSAETSPSVTSPIPSTIPFSTEKPSTSHHVHVPSIPIKSINSSNYSYSTPLEGGESPISTQNEKKKRGGFSNRPQIFSTADLEVSSSYSATARTKTLSSHQASPACIPQSARDLELPSNTTHFKGLSGFQRKFLANPYLLSPMSMSLNFGRNEENREERKKKASRKEKEEGKKEEEEPEKVGEIKWNGLKEKTLYQIPMEKPLLTDDDLKFLEKIMKKKTDEQAEIKVGEQAWEIKMFDRKTFDLGNVYKDFLMETQPSVVKSLMSSKEINDSKEPEGKVKVAEMEPSTENITNTSNPEEFKQMRLKTNPEYKIICSSAQSSPLKPTSNPSFKKVSFESLENSSHSFTTKNQKNDKKLTSNNIFNVSSLLDNYMKIENFYLDGNIKNYLIHVSEKEKKGTKQRSHAQNNDSTKNLLFEQSESLLNENYIRSKYESKKDLIADENLTKTQANLSENKTLKQKNDDFFSSLNQNIVLDNLRISCFCRLAEVDDVSSSILFACSKFSFNVSQNSLNKILLSQNKLFIHLNCDFVFQIDINGERVEDPNNLLINSGIYLGIEGTKLKVGTNLIEIVTGIEKMDYVLDEENNVSLFYLSLPSFLPQIPSLPALHSLEFLYPESKSLISSLTPLFQMNLKNINEISENICFFSLKKSVLAKFNEIKSNNLGDKIIGFGEIEEIVSFDQVCFYGGKKLKRKILQKAIATSEVMKLSSIFFSNYFKKLSFLPSQLKIIIGKLSSKPKTFKNLCFINQKLFLDDQREAELYLTLLMQGFVHFFESNGIEAFGDKMWLIHGVGLFAISHFIEKEILSQSFPLLRSTLPSFIFLKKTFSLLDDLLLSPKTLSLSSISNSYSSYPPHSTSHSSSINPITSLNLSSSNSFTYSPLMRRYLLEQGGIEYKSLYFLKQLGNYVSKKAINEVLMDFDFSNDFSVVGLIQSFFPFLRENERTLFFKWAEEWINGKELYEISIEIFSQTKKPLFIEDLIVSQNCVQHNSFSKLQKSDNYQIDIKNGSDKAKNVSQEKEKWRKNKETGGKSLRRLNFHFLELSLINVGGSPQFRLDLIVPSLESCLVESLRGKYLPRAILTDGEDSAYFILKLDEKSELFLKKSIFKLKNVQHKLLAISAYFFKVFRNELNVLDFLQILKFNLEQERDLVVVLYEIKLWRKLLKELGRTEIKDFWETVLKIENNFKEAKNYFQKMRMELNEDLLTNGNQTPINQSIIIDNLKKTLFLESQNEQKIEGVMHSFFDENVEGDEGIKILYDLIKKEKKNMGFITLALKGFQVFLGEQWGSQGIKNEIWENFPDDLLNMVKEGHNELKIKKFIKCVFSKEILRHLESKRTIFEKIKKYNILYGLIIEKKIEFSMRIQSSLKINRKEV